MQARSSDDEVTGRSAAGPGDWQRDKCRHGGEEGLSLCQLNGSEVPGRGLVELMRW